MEIVLNENEYFTGLVNLVLFVRVYATNTSRRPANIVDTFATETLEYGDTKSFQFAEMPKVEDYSMNSSLLTNKPIKYAQEFIGDPIKKKIPLSRVEPFLKMAVTGSAGFAAIVSLILGLMYSAKENYLYDTILTDLFAWRPTVETGKEMMQNITLLPTTGVTAAQEINAIELQNQKRIEKAWQKTFDDFSIYTDVFLDIDNVTNNSNFQSALNLNDLVFIGNAKFLNERVIDLMATMLKSDVIDSNFKRPSVLKIPQRTCDAKNAGTCIGFVAHKYWYQWFYHFNFMGSFLDIDTVRIKNVLHFWYSKGKLKHLPVMRLDVAA